MAAQRSHKEAGKSTAEMADSELGLGKLAGVKMGYYSVAHWCATVEFSLPSLTLKEVKCNSTICLFPGLKLC